MEKQITQISSENAILKGVYEKAPELYQERHRAEEENRHLK